MKRTLTGAIIALAALTSAHAEQADPKGENYAVPGDTVTVARPWTVGCLWRDDLRHFREAVGTDRQDRAARIMVERCQRVVALPAPYGFAVDDADLGNVCIRLTPEARACRWVMREHIKMIKQGGGHR
ncbi:hypothetical protein [Bradyrhizobium yuanmingense]|uniref:hypothetical protein n=1 Tax=Bradyrhizobium yuanmingense TaxID=108015 RepID=UPI001CD2E1C1|nr:hypothetical protein [Bradyrhizobium yuanmingense]MCA1524315.1 hypothetical protein [Bradyrhizobium yuanmingense]